MKKLEFAGKVKDSKAKKLKKFGQSVWYFCSAVNNIQKMKHGYMKTLVKLLDEHLCVVNISLAPMTVHYIERGFNVPGT